MEASHWYVNHILKLSCIVKRFFTDRCALREPEVVEKIQWKILQSFIHLINKTHPHEPLRFARCMDKITQMRELTDLNYKANKNLENFQKSLIQNYPLLYECVTYEGWMLPITKCNASALWVKMLFTFYMTHDTEFVVLYWLL
jgi:hypothetical protein